MKAPEHPDWVRATVRALAQAEVSAAEIHRRITRGQIPEREAYQLPLRTVQSYAQRAKQQLEPIGDDDMATANAIERAVLRITRNEVHRLELKQKKTGLTTGEAQALRAHFATVEAIRQARRRRDDPAPSPPAETGDNGASEKRASQATLLERIASDMERKDAA